MASMGILLRIPNVGGSELEAALAALQTVNELWLRRNPGTPSVYEWGHYVPERATEEWLPIPFLLARGGEGDCEDLAAARAAELRVSGEDPGARAVAYRSRPKTWHAVVRRGDGTVEDPSLVLGMGWHRGVLSQGAQWADATMGGYGDAQAQWADWYRTLYRRGW